LKPYRNEWFYQPGGGPLLDLGVYNLASLTGWLGPARRVTAFTATALAERAVNGRPVPVRVEDNAHVLLDFGGGCLAVVTTGYVMQQYRCPSIELYGTDGTIQMLGDDWDPDGYEMWQNAAGAWLVYKETTPDWPWADGLRHLVECLHVGSPPAVTPGHAIHVLEIVLAAQAAGRDGQARELRTRFTPPAPGDAGPPEAAHRVHDRTRKELLE
jgi:predicted dehydrogenase